MADKNYVIYHRNNRMLGLINNFDKDGDMDDNYALLRNTALTGRILNDKFLSQNTKRLSWLIECAIKGCSVCNGIFANVNKGDYSITPFYKEKVLKITTNEDLHPLYEYIMKKFNGKIIK